MTTAVMSETTNAHREDEQNASWAPEYIYIIRSKDLKRPVWGWRYKV